MAEVTLGKTGIIVNKDGFEALPVQRIPVEDVIYLTKKAYESGTIFFDTVRNHADSGEELGAVLEGICDKVLIAAKTAAETAERFQEDLEISLKNLKTDHVDLYQFHNPSFCPKPGDGTGLYEAVLGIKEQGKIRRIGITNHRLSVAIEVIDSGIHETLQLPFCHLATDKGLGLVEQCRKAGTGFVAIKALSDGLINSSRVAYAYLAQFDNVLPIWGVQREWELGEFLSHTGNPPETTDEIRVLIDKDKKELLEEFCRGYEYCMSYPVGIEISNHARMSLMTRRAPPTAWLTPDAQEKMKKTEQCLHYNQCKGKCSYSLGTLSLLEESLKDYLEIPNEEEY